MKKNKNYLCAHLIAKLSFFKRWVTELKFLFHITRVITPIYLSNCYKKSPVNTCFLDILQCKMIKVTGYIIFCQHSFLHLKIMASHLYWTLWEILFGDNPGKKYIWAMWWYMDLGRSLHSYIKPLSKYQKTACDKY